MKDLYRLLRYARPHAAALLLGTLLTSIVGLFEAARISLVQPIFDGLAGTNNLAGHSLFRNYLPSGQSLWTTIAALMVLFTVLKGLAFFFSSYLLTDVGQKVIVRLRHELYDRSEESR